MKNTIKDSLINQCLDIFSIENEILKKTKENEKMIIMKDNEIFNEKIKNIDNKIKELKTFKINYKKFLENDDIKEQIIILKEKNKLNITTFTALHQ